MLRLILAATFFSAIQLRAGEIYYTGFENFPAGDDTITGTEGWAISSAHAGRALHGVDTEADHLVSGIGNAAFIGGNITVLPPDTSRTVFLRRQFSLDPVALNEEVATFHAIFGIKDSTFSGFATRRDNFEFAFHNSDRQLIAFIQFDNSLIDPLTQSPAQRIWRSHYNGTVFTKVNTNVIFLYDEIMELRVRVNFRTNRWTASLDDLTLFADEVFYAGLNARNLGYIAAQMQIVGTAPVPGTFQIGPAPGENYMLFDDFALRLDPLPKPVIYSLVPAGGGLQLTWSAEAGYRYQVQYRNNLTTGAWLSDLPGSLFTATLTGESPVFTDASISGQPVRFYQVVQSYP